MAGRTKTHRWGEDLTVRKGSIEPKARADGGHLTIYLEFGVLPARALPGSPRTIACFDFDTFIIYRIRIAFGVREHTNGSCDIIYGLVCGYSIIKSGGLCKSRYRCC